MFINLEILTLDENVITKRYKEFIQKKTHTNKLAKEHRKYSIHWNQLNEYLSPILFNLMRNEVKT